MMSFIWANAEKVGALATAGAFIATFINGVFQETRFRKQLKQQREQWLNDAFAKEEAQLWIEFREKVSHELLLFLHLIEGLLVNKNENSYYCSIEGFSKDFTKSQGNIKNILTIHRRLQPYWNVAISLNFERLKLLLREIHNFYSNTSYEDSDIEYKGTFKYEKETSGWLQGKYLVTDNSLLKYLFLEIIGKLYPRKSSPLDLLLVDTPSNESIQQVFDLLKQEIDSINEALNVKVTAHLKNK